VFADESGFRLLPMRVRTWALRGQTPRLSVPLNPKHLSVMGGMTLDGRWLTWQLDHACRGEDCVYFLRHLLHQIAGKVLVIWDGLPAHRSQLVKDFLRTEAAGRLWLVALPAYAPDLNPIEALWNYLKRLNSPIFAHAHPTNYAAIYAEPLSVFVTAKTSYWPVFVTNSAIFSSFCLGQ